MAEVEDAATDRESDEDGMILANLLRGGVTIASIVGITAITLYH